MSICRRSFLLSVSITAALLGSSPGARGATIVSVGPSASWLGYMNVFELPQNGGAYVFGSPWGTADLRAVFSGPKLTLFPNSIGDPAPFWYVGGGGPGAQGNKNMEANMYLEFTGPLAGQTLTFVGEVLSNTLVSPYTSVAFIKDFAPDYSSFTVVTTPLVPGPFSLTLATINDPARHVQYGFTTLGPDVWITDAPGKGAVEIIPEPAGVALGFIGLLGLGLLRRNRREFP